PQFTDLAPVPNVEFSQPDRVKDALFKAKHIAIVVAAQQADAAKPVIDALQSFLTSAGKKVEQVDAVEYLKYIKDFGWEPFTMSEFHASQIRTRPQRYDLIVALELAEMPSGVVKPDILPISPSMADPGPRRGLVQFAVAPVYDSEDAISLASGDADGLRQAAEALRNIPVDALEKPTALRAVKDLVVKVSSHQPEGIRQFPGLPIHEITVSPDGQ